MTKRKKRKAGRPKLDINKKELEQCLITGRTIPQISDYFRCSEVSISRKCKEYFGMGPGAAKRMYSEKGRTQLLFAQYKAAINGNTTMMIWLGKQLLNQTDPDRQKKEDKKDDPVIFNVSL